MKQLNAINIESLQAVTGNLKKLILNYSPSVEIGKNHLIYETR